MKQAILLMVALVLVPTDGWGRRAAGRQGRCLPCHARKTPGPVRVWRASAHARGGVGCVACHGKDHDRIDAGKARVGIATCGRCHAKATAAHGKSRHGLGLHTGWGCTRNQAGRGQSKVSCRFCHNEGSELPKTGVQCARFLKQSTEMREAGCNRCHQVERSCATCHTSHATDLKIVRHPNVCAKCHMGPDHPQWEMWKTSRHGTLHASAGPRLGATCQDCHMPGGTHDVSRGLTMTPLGKLYPVKERARRRQAMLGTCARCHGRDFASRELARADRIRKQSLELVARARAIIRDLAKRRKLVPMPDKRPPHPQRGQELVLDAQMLYEEISHIERLFFKMSKFDLAKAVKGAYHQNPAYTHWYGNAELKLTLADIKAEAARLLAGGAPRPAPAAPSTAGGHRAAVERGLRRLKQLRADGKITEERHRAEKQRLLRRFISGGAD